MQDSEIRCRELKPSSYNYRTTLPDGGSLYFNFFSLSLLTPDTAETKKMDAILARPNDEWDDPEHAQIKSHLLENGFLVASNVSELDWLRSWHHGSRRQQKNLSLTIMPTLSCNFRCIYCYQQHPSVAMGSTAKQALKALVQSRLQKKGALHVTWFGGEPLFSMGCIEELSTAFQKSCQDKEASYSARIITNGSLFTRQRARRLKACKVTAAQITLDGPAAVHDRRRPAAGGVGTFDTIMANLKSTAGVIPVNLRINVDASNQSCIQELLDLLVREGLNENVHPYLGQTYPYTETCADVAGQCLDDADFALLGLETAMQLIAKGFGSFQIPKGLSTYCMAERENAFVVTPGGDMLKCWNDASGKDVAVGHLLKPADEKMRRNALAWQRRNIFEFECADCLLLPICMGGCPYLFYKTGRLNCHGWKYHLDESLAVYHYLKCLQRDREIVQSFDDLVHDVKAAAGRL
jgi:uncharacterized protein